MRQITMKLPYHVLFIKGTSVLVTFPIFLYLSIKIITADLLKKTPQEIESALKKFKIIPDVLDVAPKKAVKIYYETEVFPDFGNELNAEDCATEPYMMEWGAEEEKYYLLVMVDPDYASQNDSSQQGQYEHSVVGNIQFENLQRGTYMSDYHGPNPQPNTGYHRYVFLIYEQPYELEFAEKRLTWPKYGDERRFNFSAKRYAAKYYLNPPIACNFFVSKWQPPRIKNTTTLKPRPTPAYPWWYLAH